MDADVKELLGLLVRAGEIASALLAKHQAAQAPVHITEAEIPEAELIERGIIPIPADIAAQLREPVEVPAHFRIGRPNFADSYPQKKKWFTTHARDELIARYHVSPNIAYRTLTHVHRSIKEQGAVFLYRNANVDVYAVDIFNKLGLVAVDTEDDCLVTFLPPEARDNVEIVNYPLVRARLESFERGLTPRAPRAVSGWGSR